MADKAVRTQLHALTSAAAAASDATPFGVVDSLLPHQPHLRKTNSNEDNMAKQNDRAYYCTKHKLFTQAKINAEKFT
jgi:hypothetical protein